MSERSVKIDGPVSFAVASAIQRTIQRACCPFHMVNGTGIALSCLARGFHMGDHDEDISLARRDELDGLASDIHARLSERVVSISERLYVAGEVLRRIAVSIMEV
jgi:hypothetical protein